MYVELKWKLQGCLVLRWKIKKRLRLFVQLVMKYSLEIKYQLRIDKKH